MKIIEYTNREGGEWIKPNGEFTEEDVLSLPGLVSEKKGCLWGFVHSYIREDNKRFDASNDGKWEGKEEAIEAIRKSRICTICEEKEGIIKNLDKPEEKHLCMECAYG